jgi:hypothetical protein
MVRAAHLLWDDAPKIFEDTLALRLCSCESEAALRAQFDRLDADLARSAGPDFALTLRLCCTYGSHAKPLSRAAARSVENRSSRGRLR